MIHELKTDSDVFKAVRSGGKTFEIRRNDRNFQVGDFLRLRQTKHTGVQMSLGSPLKYVGAPLTVEVIYILKGPIYGLKKGWVIMSIEPE